MTPVSAGVKFAAPGRLGRRPAGGLSTPRDEGDGPPFYAKPDQGANLPEARSLAAPPLECPYARRAPEGRLSAR
jgi:hypothetical protein